jgi:hypothetical protein
MSIDECDGDDETLADVITEYVAACQRSNEPAANYNLGDTVEHHLVGAVSLRFIYLGMIAEVARHAGHADILAEQIQAATKSSTDAVASHHHDHQPMTPKFVSTNQDSNKR